MVNFFKIIRYDLEQKVFANNPRKHSSNNLFKYYKRKVHKHIRGEVSPYGTAVAPRVYASIVLTVCVLVSARHEWWLREKLTSLRRVMCTEKKNTAGAELNWRQLGKVHNVCLLYILCSMAVLHAALRLSTPSIVQVFRSSLCVIVVFCSLEGSFCRVLQVVFRLVSMTEEYESAMELEIATAVCSKFRTTEGSRDRWRNQRLPSGVESSQRKGCAKPRCSTISYDVVWWNTDRKRVEIYEYYSLA